MARLQNLVKRLQNQVIQGRIPSRFYPPTCQAYNGPSTSQLRVKHFDVVRVLIIFSEFP